MGGVDRGRFDKLLSLLRYVKATTTTLHL